MKLLFYQWGSNYDSVSEKIFKSHKDLENVTLKDKVNDFHIDSTFSLKLMTIINSEKIDAVFSYDYFPVISIVCDVVKIPYISWILDCPMLTLQSKTVANDCNYIFNFDRLYTERVAALGCRNSIYLPLGAYENMKWQGGGYKSDISFVGSLYTDSKNRYRNIAHCANTKANDSKLTNSKYNASRLDEYTEGFVNGLINAQEKIYGYNIFRDSLNDEVVLKYNAACELELGDMFIQDPYGLCADSLSVETTARERIHVLDMLSDYWNVDLYTDCKLEPELKKDRLHMKGRVDYETQMPVVFHNSRINLNMTSKSIESGIPLRIFDILACGGFCMTNYQLEVAEYFEDGVDLVMYTSLDDLKRKCDYYLTHEEERAEIAHNGYKKVMEQYTVGQAIDKMLATLNL